MFPKKSGMKLLKFVKNRITIFQKSITGEDALIELGRNYWEMQKMILKKWELDVGGGVIKVGKIGLFYFGRL